jgi:hypothetical protein
MVLGGEVVDLSALTMTLSWSRKRVTVWARSKDMLSWQACQTGCFRRLGGAPAVLRIDNVKTAVAKGAGSWGVVNPTYRRDAAQLKFDIDACQPRQPQAKGKVERGIRDQRAALDPYGEVFDSLEALQAWSDARLEARAERLRGPATGTSVAEASEIERTLLTPFPRGASRDLRMLAASLRRIALAACAPGLMRPSFRVLPIRPPPSKAPIVLFNLDRRRPTPRPTRSAPRAA